ncbi:MAG: GerAB/ArcD/ProY family transporter [Clostridia bacterium]|nr:GerAB/ArcD/ProY family transporter [Clostridia bacterium]
MPYSNAIAENDGVHARQIAFFAAFVLPVYKLMETPSLLARYAQGDLLWPALAHFLLQTGVLLLLLYAASRSDKPLLLKMEETLGKWSTLVYIAYALFFLFYAVLPLLDLEKFVYAAFYDTSPTLFSFAFFFILCGFVCTKGLKCVGRLADLSLFLFLLPFLLLLLMSLVEADASNLLPIFQRPLSDSAKAFTYTTPHFSDTVLLLPLIGNLRYKKGDGKKISLGYALGATLVLLFLGVFYAVYSTLAAREHYAFAKLAQYFPALSVVGRIDLLLVYILCIVLFFLVCTPLSYGVHCLARTTGTSRKTLLSVAVALVAFLFVLFCNKYYDGVYALISGKLFVLFYLFADLIPLLLLLPALTGKKAKRKEKRNA